MVLYWGRRYAEYRLDALFEISDGMGRPTLSGLAFLAVVSVLAFELEAVVCVEAIWWSELEVPTILEDHVSDEGSSDPVEVSKTIDDSYRLPGTEARREASALARLCSDESGGSGILLAARVRRRVSKRGVGSCRIR